MPGMLHPRLGNKETEPLVSLVFMDMLSSYRRIKVLVHNGSCWHDVLLSVIIPVQGLRASGNDRPVKERFRYSERGIACEQSLRLF